ncbi:MAG: MFS transporter [Cyanobacteria bacterium P01_C01_bin.70]
MRKFTILWLAYLIAEIGNYTAYYAFTFWMWDQTGSATALALTGFFYQLPRLGTALIAGIVVDRIRRQYLMIFSEVIEVISTLVLLGLYVTGHLAIWHLYAAALVNGGFEKFGQLAYRTSITLLVEPPHYTRANSMNAAIGYGVNIVAPTIAGLLYPLMGLGNIWLLNLVTYGISILIIALLPIPQPLPDNSSRPKTSSLLAAAGQEVTFGLRYLWGSPALRTLLGVTLLFAIAQNIGGTVYNPMILARTDGNSQALGATATIAGFGGVTGAIILSVWGGFRRNQRGLQLGFIGAGLAKVVFGLGQGLSVWLPAQFCSSLNFPLINSSETALWMAAIPPKVQGRVFAAQSLVFDVMGLLIAPLAGVMGDTLFEPAMASPGLMQSLFAPIFGTGPGSGLALLYGLSAVAMLLVGLVGFRLSRLRDLEK